MEKNTWVSGQAHTRQRAAPYEDAGPSIVIEPSGAWQNVAPSEMAHTSGQDRAKGLLILSIPVLLLELVLAIAMVALGMIALGIDAGFGQTLLLILLAWGGLGLASYLFLAERQNHYSTTGVEHHRISSAENVAVEQIHADKDIRLLALRSYMEMLEKSADNEPKQLTRGPR